MVAKLMDPGSPLNGLDVAAEEEVEEEEEIVEVEEVEAEIEMEAMIVVALVSDLTTQIIALSLKTFLLRPIGKISKTSAARLVMLSLVTLIATVAESLNSVTLRTLNALYESLMEPVGMDTRCE
jgi:hypothetical protein